MPDAIAVLTDLIFRTRIESTAQSVGRGMTTVASIDALSKALEAREVDLVMVDMSLPAESATQAITTAKTHPSAPQVIAFVSHVETEATQAARAAGADTVMARSAFTAKLPELLTPSE